MSYKNALAEACGRYLLIPLNETTNELPAQ